MHIAIEGLDGTGKTSTAKLLAELLGFQYHSKALHRMKNFDAPDRYDNFITLNECVDSAPSARFEYGMRAAFLNDRLSRVDTVTERYFCSNYAANPSPDTIQSIRKVIELLGAPDLTVILYCRPEVNYQRMYERNPDDKDFHKLQERENFYANIRKCAEIFNLPKMFLDTSDLTLNEVCAQLVDIVRKLPPREKNCIRRTADISDGQFLFSADHATVLGLQENIQESKLILPQGVKRIGFGAFAASAVEEFIMNDDCEEIGCCAFSGCRQLRRFNLGAKTAYLGKNAFAGSGLFKITGGSPTFVVRDNALFHGRKLVKFSRETSHFEDDYSAEHAAWSFENNPFVKSIVAERLEKIGSYAYKDSALQEISLSACREIHERAFWNCRGLKRLKFLSPEPPKIKQEIFFGVSSPVEILVPEGSGGRYKTAFRACENAVRVIEC